MRTKILLILLFIGVQFHLKGQNYPFEHLNEENGLQQISITSIYQDHNKYMWIGTPNGLLSYDGFEFEPYYEPGKQNNFDGAILAIQGNSFKICFLTKEQIHYLSLKDKKIHSFFFPPNTIQNPSKICFVKNDILIGSSNGLWRYNIENNKFTNEGIKEPITDIKTQFNGKIVISTSVGFFLYYPFNYKLIACNFRPNYFITNLIIEDQNTISWIEADNNFYHGKLIGNTITIDKTIALSKFSKPSAFALYKKNYIIGTGQGILLFDSLGNEFQMQHREEEFQSLSQNEVNCLYIDHANNLWVGTNFGGINLHHPYRYKFNLIAPSIATQYAKCKEILSFEETQDGQILVQNKVGGIGIFNPQNKSLSNWTAAGFAGNCLKAETADKNKFLIGTSNGLYCYNYLNHSITKINTKNKVKNFESDIKSILPYKNNTYWMAGADGFFLFDRTHNQTIENYTIGNSNLSTDNIRFLYRKNEKEIFACTAFGLNLFNCENKEIKLIPIIKNKKQTFISTIAADKQGNFWVGTGGEGIYILLNNGKIKNLNTENGLGNNMIYSMQMDLNGENCWVSTNKGLSVINTSNFEIKNHQKHDGVQGSEFVEAASLKTKSGMLYFGGVSGFNFFNPKQIPIDTNDCEIQIKHLSIFNEQKEYAPYYNIPTEQNYISFEFTALDYYLSGKHDFYCQLEGLQTDWTEIGERRFTSFAQLSPGDYIFRVKAKNPDGNMSKHEAKLYFSVYPPYYQSWWFKSLSFLLLIFVISLIVYARIQFALKEEKELSEKNKMIAELELKALRAQMNPHFIFNSLNSIQDFVLNNEGQLAAKYLSKFAKLIRMILDISELTYVNIQAKVDFLSIYLELELLRLNNSFTYHFDIDPEIDTNALIPTLIIQPHIENAIWHGLQFKKGGKQLKIQLKKLDEKLLQVSIEDNGIGRAAAMEIKKNKLNLHHSKGAQNTEDRLATLQKLFGSKPKIEIIDLYDENKVACGTKIIMQIPIINA